MTTHTDASYLREGDRVAIVETLDGDRGAVGQTGTLRLTSGPHPVVRLADGREVTATKVHKDTGAPPKRSRRPRAEKAFVRFVVEYGLQHDGLTVRDLSRIFRLPAGTVPSWKQLLRRDATRFPRYTPEQAERWTREYLAAPAPTATKEGDDAIAVECLERVYTLTDGALVLSARVGRTELSATATLKEASLEIPTLPFPTVRALARLLDGAARLGEETATRGGESTT